MITGTIIINRKSAWNNRARKMGIYLDGQKLDTIGNGETKEFDVPTGEHTLRAKIDWLGSRDVHFFVGVDETKTFVLSDNPGISKLFFVASILLAITLVFRFDGTNNYRLWLGIPALIILIYFLVIKRNEYLLLREVEG